MTEPLVKTRFAPSPTGPLHLGNIRTALFNYLFARRAGGVFLLRFEDTDLERSAAEHEPGMLEDLRWLGIEWQEGPEAGGDAGPYRQSQRESIYTQHFRRLVAQDLVYPCFCSPGELEQVRRRQRQAGLAPRYPGTCAQLTHGEIAAREKEGIKSTLRFRVPRDRVIGFDDLVRGQQQFRCDDIGDFIVRRSDGTPAFFFSNAVDDALMGITHVLRGEDHLSNTPRQILILEGLGLRIPEYGHTAMLVGPDGIPLAKRHASHSVRELRDEGYFPGAVVNYLLRLGHRCASDAYLDPVSMIQAFDPGYLGRAPAHYEDRQLLHWQREAIRHTSDSALWSWLCGHSHTMGGHIQDVVPVELHTDFVHTIRGNIDSPPQAYQLAYSLFGDSMSYEEPALETIRSAGTDFYRAALDVLEQGQKGFEPFVTSLGGVTGRKGKALFMPLRAVLTGGTHGPEMARLWDLIGPERVRSRLTAALELLS